MCGINQQYKVQVISVQTESGVQSQLINNTNLLTGHRIYGIAVRETHADRKDKKGNSLVNAKVMKASHIILREDDGCIIADMPLEMLQTCCNRMMYAFPDGIVFKPSNSQIYHTGDVGNIVAGEVYELIIWYLPA